NPPSATVSTSGQQAFTATVTDDLGSIINGQAVNWGLNNGCGTLSAPNGTGTTFTGTIAEACTLTASLSGYPSGTASITVINSGVIFSSATTAVVYLTSATLSATATQASGHSLSYTWSVLSPLGANVGFSPNGAVSASGVPSISLATLPAAGTYTIQCTVTDTTTNLFATTSVTFTLSQVVSAITVTPNNVTLKVLQDQMFTANGFDQFGGVINGFTGVTWSTSGGGNVSQA